MIDLADALFLGLISHRSKPSANDLI